MKTSKGISFEKERKETTLTRFRSTLAAQMCGAIIMALVIGSVGISRGAVAESKDSQAISNAAEKSLSDLGNDKMKSKQERFQVLMQRAKDHRKQQQYKQALIEAEEALKIYPDDKAAQFLANQILSESNKSRDELLKAKSAAAADVAMGQIDKERVIPANVLTYPGDKDWATVVARSTRLGAGVRGPIVPDWETALKDRLEQRLSFSFENATLQEVARYLQDVANVTIVIDPKAPIAKAPITLTAAGVKLESALNQVCRFAEMKWSMADRMIYISDRAVSDEPQLAVYEVTDLILPVRDFRSNGQSTSVAGNAPRETSSGDLLVQIDFPGSEGVGKVQESHGIELVDFIKGNISPGTWSREEEAGQSVNSVQYRNGRLVVAHNAKVQTQILKLLESFRRARTVQITVQARFIQIEKNYLEQIGVDWTGLNGGVNTISDAAEFTPISSDGTPLPTARGASFRGNGALDEFGNPWSSGYLQVPDLIGYQGLPNGYDAVYGIIPDGYGRNYEPTTYWVDQNGDGIRQPNEWKDAKRLGGSYDVGMSEVNTLGVSLGDSTTNFGADGGLMLDLAYLSSYQVRMLLNAVEKHRKGNVLTSPRITCFNGERANIAVTSQVNYMRNIQQGTPEIATITDGIVFEVVPYASADRRYVTMELLPTLRTLVRPIREQHIEVPEYLDDGAVSLTVVNVQLPTVIVKSVETFASVPDGGTLMLGGLSRAAEIKARSTVPILGDIPILKYLFTSWGNSDTRNSLIILVRADILIQGEQEPNVGPAS